jgi:hypothetical protein
MLVEIRRLALSREFAREASRERRKWTFAPEN